MKFIYPPVFKPKAFIIASLALNLAILHYNTESRFYKRGGL
ncbi:hypothetical protein [Helicobacter jaachi]|nr:hypothetical protein [Helicobacter jaachi]